MIELKLSLKNCFGIKKLNHTFNFDKSNINILYARNGLMKTSLTKTFKMIQNNQIDKISDMIFGCVPTVTEIEVDGTPLTQNNIFVIKSFENSYESDSVASLLINEDIKSTLDKLLKSRDIFLKAIEKHSGVKKQRVLQGKKIYDLEPILVKDFEFNNSSVLLNMPLIDYSNIDYDYSGIKYSSIFDDSVLKKIKSVDFQDKISDFMTKSEEVYTQYAFLEKGKLSLSKLKEVQKGLKNNSYFVKDNQLLLNGDIPITDPSELNDMIKEIELELQETIEFKEIEKLLSDAKGRILKDVIENNPEIITELKIANLDILKKKLWFSYIKKEELKFTEMYDLFKVLEDKIDEVQFDETPWQEAIEIFNNRFTVPYCMDLENLKSAIIGESIPKVIFRFCKDGNTNNLDEENWRVLDRNSLDASDTLSQGERRALYLLNIIFDIERIRRTGEDTLLVIDDIADSFDYKNKYAIVEYLKEISDSNIFNLLVLSHNFDFYRTVASRLNIPRKNRYSATRNSNEIVIEQEFYQRQPFAIWKENLNKKNVIALIPFVRNLIEYGVDRNVNLHAGIDEDYLLMTHLLHQKEDSTSISYQTLKMIYKEYLGNDDFIELDDSVKIISSIYEVADTITTDDSRLENKIVLSIATRLKAESYMMRKINDSDHTFEWKKGRQISNGTNIEFLEAVSESGNQTRKLFDGYSQIGENQTIRLLDNVNTMTPESIHLNSFMYEPILDMDVVELKKIYDEVSLL